METQPIPVAFVDDDADLREANAQALALAGYRPCVFASAEEALEAIDASFAGVVVTDLRMPRIDGMQLFRRLKTVDPELPVILITGHGDVAMAVDAMKEGAYDFIVKPYTNERLGFSLARAVEQRKLTLENRSLRERAERVDEDLPLIGETPSIQALRRSLRQIAATDIDVLVTGETGSGKEVVARLLHQWSPQRRDHPFVALNCGALPESVIESELFGHEAGAFTGAQKKRVGQIEYSSGGTLFLDEIESMPVALQIKLLRVLELREITPLGSNVVRRLDLRVVAAAKVDLGNPRERGDFREDLYYRLNVVTIDIPALRARRQDIPLLFAHFLTRAAQRFRREIPPLSASVQEKLLAHDWPGNVRELSHFADRVALGLEPETSTPSTRSTGLATAQPGLSLPERLELIEGELIREALSLHGGDVRETLVALGLPRKTFYDKLHRHGIDRRSYE